MVAKIPDCAGLQTWLCHPWPAVWYQTSACHLPSLCLSVTPCKKIAAAYTSLVVTESVTSDAYPGIRCFLKGWVLLVPSSPSLCMWEPQNINA